MVADPAVKPVTTPVPGFATATDMSLLLQVPPAVPSAKVVVDPEHTVVSPVMAAGSKLTVTSTVVMQPVDKV